MPINHRKIPGFLLWSGGQVGWAAPECIMATAGKLCTSLLGSVENVWIHTTNSSQLTPPPSWDVPGWTSWGSHRTSTGALASVRLPHSSTKSLTRQAPCALGEVSHRVLLKMAALGGTLRLAPQSPHSLPFPQHISPTSTSTLDFSLQNYEKHTLVHKLASAMVMSRQGRFPHRLPHVEETGFSAQAAFPSSSSVWLHDSYSFRTFLMTPFLVTNSFSSHI